MRHAARRIDAEDFDVLPADRIAQIARATSCAAPARAASGSTTARNACVFASASCRGLIEQPKWLSAASGPRRNKHEQVIEPHDGIAACPPQRCGRRSTVQSPAGPASTRSPDSGYTNTYRTRSQPGEREHRRIERLMRRLPPRNFAFQSRQRNVSQRARLRGRLRVCVSCRGGSRAALGGKYRGSVAPSTSAAACRRIDQHTAGKRSNFRLAAAVLRPRLGGDGRHNQVDQRIEIGVRGGAALAVVRWSFAFRSEQETVLRTCRPAPAAALTF